MSADLLAAFGVAQWNEQHNSTAPKEDKANEVSQGATIDEAVGQKWILQSNQVLKPQFNQPNTPLWKHDSQGAEVLFDASDHDDEDDFGDFEEVPVEGNHNLEQKSEQMPSANIDLLGLDDLADLHVSRPAIAESSTAKLGSPVSNRNSTKPDHLAGFDQPVPYDVQAIGIWERDQREVLGGNQKHETYQQSGLQGKSSDDDDWGNFEEVGGKEDDSITVNTLKSLQKTNPSNDTLPEIDDNDNWDAFDDGPLVVEQPQRPVGLAKTSQRTSTATEAATKSHTPVDLESKSRPTNIPPPSTLLQLLPKIYHSLSQQARLPTPPSDLALVILRIYITTARIISGRTHRWKRDTLLSQSTRISQAGLKNTGMKLTALDKSETVKEDQEAQEALTAWQRHAAALNAVMLKAKVQKPPMSLSLNMGVRVGAGAAVLNARECCAVCGLKRNERVTGIDIKVEDLFGEFWIEHWGHRDCCEFWYRYEGLLNKR